MKETDFSKIVVDKARRVGAKVFNVHGHREQASGWPDLQIYHPWWTGHLELKVKTNGCSPLQKKRIRDLRSVGTDALVMRLNGSDVTFEDEDGTVLFHEVEGEHFLRTLQRFSQA